METKADRKWWVLLAIGIGTFMTALDTSVVNTILPLISRTFNQSVAEVEWVVTIYLLILSGLLLGFGRFGDLKGHKNIYLAGFGIFILSSIFCGLATRLVWLVISRAFQAIGAAMLASNSPAILTKNFPSNQRGRALGMQATMTYLGLTVGPSLGGWLATEWGWPVVFYINVPVGAIAFLLSWRYIPDDGARLRTEKFDFAGAGLFLTGLSMLLLALNQGHSWGWTSIKIIFLFAGAILIVGYFIKIEYKQKSPMLDMNLFKLPAFSLTAVSAVLNYMGVFFVIFLMPFYLIKGLEMTPAEAGLVLTAQPIVMAIVAPLSGTISDWIGTRLPAMVGMTLLTAGLILLGQLNFDTPMVQIVLSLAVVGLGTGIFISPNNSALMGTAPPDRQGIAAGILATARNIGMVLGVGLAGAIFTTLMSRGNPVGGAIPNSLSKDQVELFHAIRVSYLFAAGVTSLGIITSAMRGKRH